MFTKPSRSVDRVFVHCSASDHPHHDNIATIRKWHVQDNGWSDVGYHYFIRKDGMLEEGRPLDRTPAAQRGHNTGTIAICLHGLHEDAFTEAQFDRLRALCIEINNAYNGKVTFHGHREVASKACPVFDYKSMLNLDEFGILGLDGADIQDTLDAQTPGSMPSLETGDRGLSVKGLQKMLMIKDDGIFGPKTAAAVRDFRESVGLSRTDVVDDATWAALFENRRIEHAD